MPSVCPFYTTSSISLFMVHGSLLLNGLAWPWRLVWSYYYQDHYVLSLNGIEHDDSTVSSFWHPQPPRGGGGAMLAQFTCQLGHGFFLHCFSSSLHCCWFYLTWFNSLSAVYSPIQRVTLYQIWSNSPTTQEGALWYNLFASCLSWRKIRKFLMALETENTPRLYHCCAN